MILIQAQHILGSHIWHLIPSNLECSDVLTQVHPQFDSHASAQGSQFNIHNRNTAYRNSSDWGARTSSSSSNVRRGGDGAGPRIGRVDDVRGPECKSCR